MTRDGTREAVKTETNHYPDFYTHLTADPIPPELVGWLPKRPDNAFSSRGPLNLTRHWYSFPDAAGYFEFVFAPPTPGDDYYRIRRILGEHALRYMDENPLAAMRLSDPDKTRIHTINYELSNTERSQAANNDYQIRGTIGFIWRLAESLRIMPPGTPALDAAWRARRDELDGLLSPFCALCEGAGLSYRTIRKHPHEAWERYQLAGLRISSDRAFNTVGLPQFGVVTDAAHKVDLRNFQAAADWAAEGFADDDYSAPIFGTNAHVHAGAPTARLPVLTGAHALERNYIAHALRKLYHEHDDALYPAALIHAGVYRTFCVLNLLTMLDERNLQHPAFVSGLIANAVFVPEITQVAGLNNNYGTIVNAFAGDFPQQGYDGGTFAGVYYTDGPLVGGFSGPWVDTAERDRRLDIVDAILGDATPEDLTHVSVIQPPDR